MCYGFKTTTHDQGFHCLNFPYFSSLIVTTQLKNCLKFYSFHKTSYSWLGVSPSSVIYLSWLPIHLLSSLEVTIQLKIASRFKVSTQLLMAWGFTCQFIISVLASSSLEVTIQLTNCWIIYNKIRIIQLSIHIGCLGKFVS
jgi:hypothetical protein